MNGFFRYLVAICLAFSSVPAAAGPQGTVRVIDGDTFDVAGERVRIFGIDAPEQDQTCGGQSVPAWACGAWVTQVVRARYEGARADCEGIERDRHGRLVARCRVKGRDVGEAMVQDGLALAYRRYSRDYVGAETSAVVAGLGVHAGGVQAPEEYRATRRRNAGTASADATTAACDIKGNISQGSGARIYHVPGQRDYAMTRIDPARGERIFCSEAEARAAGWRRAAR